MKQYIFKITMICIAAVFAVSCNDYLSELPGRGTDEPLRSVEQLEGLLDNSTTLMYETSPTLCFSSDDFGATMQVAENNEGAFAYSDALTYFTLATDGVANLAEDNCWSDQYNKIFTANLIISEIDNIKGLTAFTRQNYLSEAHFIRALSYWWLVNHYAMPYAEENLDMPGVPLKMTTSYEESLVRASIREVFTLIEADLTEALKTNVTSTPKSWRLSRPAAEAFASRFYLFTGDYAKAETHADNALSASKGLRDYNDMCTIPNELWGGNGPVELELPEIYMYTPTEYAVYDEFYYTRFIRNWSTPKFYPSRSLLALYDQNHDLRFRYLMVENGGEMNGISVGGGNRQYVMFQYVFGGDMLPTGPTVAEVLLNKAEAQARQGDHGPAMATLNILRAKRFDSSADYELTATDKDDAILKVLEERRRELPFSMRWFDIRRFAYNETSIDDVALSFDFFAVNNGQIDFERVISYTLPLKSPRYAVPIRTADIRNSQGQTLQNQY